MFATSSVTSPRLSLARCVIEGGIYCVYSYSAIYLEVEDLKKAIKGERA